MIDYVAGFLFSFDGNRVALIRKQRPAWQRGRLNGIGGKVEPGESPEQAMRREFAEETGVEVKHWTLKATLTGPDWRVYFFASRAQIDVLRALRTTTDEEVGVYQTSAGHIPEEAMPNLRWLIPLCADADVIGARVYDGSRTVQGASRTGTRGE